MNPFSILGSRKPDNDYSVDFSEDQTSLPADVYFRSTLNDPEVTNLTPTWHTDGRLITRPSTSSGQNGFLTFEGKFETNPALYQAIWFEWLGYSVEQNFTGTQSLCLANFSTQVAGGGRIFHKDAPAEAWFIGYASTGGEVQTEYLRWKPAETYEKTYDIGRLFVYFGGTRHWLIAVTIDGNIVHRYIVDDFNLTAFFPYHQHQTQEATGKLSFFQGARMRRWLRR